MKTIRIYRLTNLPPGLFRRLKAAQMEAARVWNVCVEAHRQARMSHARWPDQHDLHHLTKGHYGLHSQSVQAVFRAFLGNIQTTRTLRRAHPEMRMKYPWHTKRFYPVKWPAQAVSRERERVVLPMGKGRPSLILPLALPENAGACTLVWNRGFELHVCVEIPWAEQAPGTVQATVDLGEIHLAAVTTGTGKALIVTGRGIRSLKRQRSKQLGQLARKQARISCSRLPERGTSSRCPRCKHKHKPKGRNWVCRHCGFRGHRDLVGSITMHACAFGIHLKFPRSSDVSPSWPAQSQEKE